MSATAATPAASSAQTRIDSGAAAAVIADPTATAADAAAIASDTTATTKTGVQASTGQPTPTPVKPQTAAPATTVATAVAATTPVAPKITSSKTAAATQTATAKSGSSETTPGTTDPAAATAQPDATTGTQDASSSAVGAAKSDASANPSPTSVVAGTVHERSAGAETGHSPTDPSGAGVQALGTIAPQLPSATTNAAPAALSVTAATNAPVPLSGLALEIAASVKNGKSSFEIRLDPADLGRIDVRIDVDRSGQVTSHLTVEKPETLSMLQQDAPQLQRALDDAGLKTGSGGLQFSLRDQSSSSQDNGNQTGSNAQRLVVSEEDTIPAAVAGRTYGRMLGSSSGVDIRV